MDTNNTIKNLDEIKSDKRTKPSSEKLIQTKVSFTQDMRLMLEESAEKEGLHLSDIVRQCIDKNHNEIFKNKPIKKEVKKTDPVLLKYMSSISNNLNQIAKKLNSHPELGHLAMHKLEKIEKDITTMFNLTQDENITINKTDGSVTKHEQDIENTIEPLDDGVIKILDSMSNENFKNGLLNYQKQLDLELIKKLNNKYNAIKKTHIWKYIYENGGLSKEILLKIVDNLKQD